MYMHEIDLSVIVGILLARSLSSPCCAYSTVALILHYIPQAEEVDVVDTSSGCGSAFDVQIVSKAFAGKTLIQRHRLVGDWCLF